MLIRVVPPCVAVILCLAGGAAAQDMPGMTMPDTTTPSMMMSATGLLGAYPMQRDASGTSWQPDLTPHQGLHAMAGDWALMGHMRLYGIYDTQGGPRGGDKSFVAGMLMGAARRDFANGDTLNLRAMLSPDPFMGKNGYPLLLASGETANGVTPLIDRQHPHDLLMELSASYSRRISQDDSVFIYGGLPGEPAFGPPAFMHRASGLDNPEAPISHHWLDSTHITFGVVTAGFVHDDWKLEVSRFTGREPDQDRFDIDTPRMDSSAARVSFNPDSHWSLQASWAHLNSSEQLVPSEDEDRLSASASYVTQLSGLGDWFTTLAYGRKDRSDGVKLGAWLLESELKPDALWTMFARAEWLQNDELGGGAVESVSKLALGAIRDFPLSEHLKIGVGGLYSFNWLPSALAPSYSGDQTGAMAFVRIVAE